MVLSLSGRSKQRKNVSIVRVIVKVAIDVKKTLAPRQRCERFLLVQKSDQTI